MKAKYIGNPDPEVDNPRRVSFGGKTFPLNTFVSLEGFPPKLAEKLKTNRFFKVSDVPLTDDESEAAKVAEVTVGAADEGATVGEKETLLAALEALQASYPDANIEFDRRWGAPRLKSTLEAAQFEIGED